LASQSRVAFFRIAPNTDLRSPGDLAMMLSTSDVAACRPGEVLVSRTVKDLVAGSGLSFNKRGKHSLKGLQEPMDLYAASN
jgi:hypothetical protein